MPASRVPLSCVFLLATTCLAHAESDSTIALQRKHQAKFEEHLRIRSRIERVESAAALLRAVKHFAGSIKINEDFDAFTSDLLDAPNKKEFELRYFLMERRISDSLDPLRNKLVDSLKRVAYALRDEAMDVETNAMIQALDMRRRAALSRSLESDGEIAKRSAEVSRKLETAAHEALNDLKARLESLDATIAAHLDALKENERKIERDLQVLEREVNERAIGRVQVDKALITWALPAFGALMIIFLLVPKFYQNVKVQEQIFNSGLILEVITVFLLTTTILLLGVSDKLKGEVLGTLLGGISGYVLGRATGRTSPGTGDTLRPGAEASKKRTTSRSKPAPKSR